MAKKIQLQDANGNVLHPLTLGECVAMDNGENLDTLMSKSQMFTPTITQDKSMFKVGTGADVDYSANVKDGAYESLVFKGRSLVNLMTSCKDETLIRYYNPPADSNVANVSMIKPNTVYTIIYSVKYQEEGNTGHLIVRTQRDGGDINVSSGFTFGTTYKRFAYKFTTPSTIDYFVLRSNGHYFHVKEVMLLEGDYTNVNLPYFEGLCDSKMPILRNVSSEAFCHDSLEGGTISGDGGGNVSSTNSRVRTKDMKKLNGATSILFSDNLLGVEKYVFSYDSNKRYLGRTPTNWETGNEIKPVEGAYYYRVVFTKYLEELPRSMYIIPKNHKTNILRTSEEIVLREVNGVQDTYNPLTGEYVQRIGEIVITSTVSKGIVVLENNIRVNIAMPSLNAGNGTTKANNTLSDKFYWSEANAKDVEGLRVNGNTFHWCISKDKLTSQDLQGVNSWLQSNPITVQYELAEPITTIIKPSTMTPFAYQNGHVVVESGFEGQSLLPEIEYSVVTGRTGQVTQNTKVLRKQEQQIIGLEELLLTQIVQMEYERTLLQFDYELQMMMLG